MRMHIWHGLLWFRALTGPMIIISAWTLKNLTYRDMWSFVGAGINGAIKESCKQQISECNAQIVSVGLLTTSAVISLPSFHLLPDSRALFFASVLSTCLYGTELIRNVRKWDLRGKLFILSDAEKGKNERMKTLERDNASHGV